MPDRSRDRIDLNDHRRKYDPKVDTDDRLIRACFDFLGGVASDLGVDSVSDEGFLDLVGDRLSDFGVFFGKIDEIIMRLTKGEGP